MSTTEVEYRPIPYRPRGAAAQLFRCYDPEVLLDGPARTGKSRAVGERLLYLATNHPQARIAVIRKTRASLSESFLQMWEERVLGDGLDETYLVDPLAGSARRANRHDGYLFKNGSLVWPGGMDNPTRLYSSEWDAIYVQEAVELTEDEWERLTRGLTNKKIPHPRPTPDRPYLAQLIGDTNPDAPNHWLNQRCLKGKTTRLQARHEDNPTLTPQDLARLRAMTGVRRARLYEGRWVAAEGAIWSNWDAGIHVLARMPKVKIVRHIAAVDWGFTGAGVMMVGAIDEAGRLYVVRQVYQTGRELDWWVTKGMHLKTEFRFEVVACDPSEPANIKTFRRYGLPAKDADNEIMAGLDAVRDRLNPADDGAPRLFVLADSLDEADPSLREVSKPTRVEEEIPGYVYDKTPDGQYVKEKPAPRQDDHGSDCLRYITRLADRLTRIEREPPPKYATGTIGSVMGWNDRDMWDEPADPDDDRE